jgi:hypothetical protein
MDERNKIFAELCGVGIECNCSYGPYPHYHVPDFVADPRLVLKEMKAKDLLDEFLLWLSKGSLVTWIHIDYILSTTGLLLDKGIEFLEERK